MDVEPENPEYTKLMKMGVFTALAIGIHNFPEGIATFASALQDPKFRNSHCHCGCYS